MNKNWKIDTKYYTTTYIHTEGPLYYTLLDKIYDSVGRHFLTGNYIARFEAAAEGRGEGEHFICTVLPQLCPHLRNINIVMGR